MTCKSADDQEDCVAGRNLSPTIGELTYFVKYKPVTMGGKFIG